MLINVSTLCENSALMGYLGEWGLAMLIEADGKRILFDTGAGQTLINNTTLMGADLNNLDCVVLSHGHHDHTGGLHDLLKIYGSQEIIAHPAALEKKYSLGDDAGEKYIGIPHALEKLEAMGGAFRYVTEPYQITPNIMTTGEVPLVTEYETIDPLFFTAAHNTAKLDTVPDDLGIIVTTDYGLVIFLGCAHRGMINTIRHAQNLTGREDVYGVIGGTHLFQSDEETVMLTIKELNDIGVQYVGASHCSGPKATALMMTEMGDRFFTNNAGRRFTLPL
ncbi:MBL fold metallo-hydrolase [Chloroflexota bacterium]